MTQDLQLRPGALHVRVRRITWLGDGINAYELVSPDGAPLPEFSAGSHVDLYFRDGRVRQYSLCNDPAETHRYVVAVQREENGRGGSKAIHDIVHAGRLLAISQPRNNFRLHEEAVHHVLVAGGIGVTPIMSMVYRLKALGASFEVHYGARTREKLGFLDSLQCLGIDDRVHAYIDGGDPARGMDLGAILRNAPAGAHFYCCGPEGLMRGLRTASAHKPADTVHFEYFAAPEPAAPVPKELAKDERNIGIGFDIRLARQQRTLNVPDDKTIVDVLRESGIDVVTSCEAGLCGTCRTRYLEGEPDHRDYVLGEDERREHLLICCSRSRSQLLVLDL